MSSYYLGLPVTDPAEEEYSDFNEFGPVPFKEDPVPAHPKCIVVRPVSQDMIGFDCSVINLCSICIEPILLGNTVGTIERGDGKCGHWFHQPCIEHLLSVKNWCPLCRNELPRFPIPQSAQTLSTIPFNIKDEDQLLASKGGKHSPALPEGNFLGLLRHTWCFVQTPRSPMDMLPKRPAGTDKLGLFRAFIRHLVHHIVYCQNIGGFKSPRFLDWTFTMGNPNTRASAPEGDRSDLHCDTPLPSTEHPEQTRTAEGSATSDPFAQVALQCVGQPLPMSKDEGYESGKKGRVVIRMPFMELASYSVLECVHITMKKFTNETRVWSIRVAQHVHFQVVEFTWGPWGPLLGVAKER